MRAEARRGTLADLGRMWVSRRRQSPPQLTRARDPLLASDFSREREAISSLQRADVPTEKLPCLSYYSIKDGHEKTFETSRGENVESYVISSYESAQAAYGFFTDLREDLLGNAETNPRIKSLVTSGEANEVQINDFYRETARLLAIIALPGISLKDKLIVLNTWDADSLNDDSRARSRLAIMKACGFDQDNFVWWLRDLIMQQAFIQAANRNPLLSVVELHKVTEALLDRLFHRTRCFQLPMTKAKQFQLLEDTANFVTELLDPKVSPESAFDIIQRYKQKIARMSYPPKLKALVTAMILAAVVLVIMMGLQAGIAGIAPVVALSMVNILAASGSAAYIWATVTLTATLATLFATFLLPRYSPYPTTRFEALFAEAAKLHASKSPLAIRKLNPGRSAEADNSTPEPSAALAAKAAASRRGSVVVGMNPMHAGARSDASAVKAGTTAPADRVLRTGSARSHRFLAGVQPTRRVAETGGGSTSTVRRPG